MGTLDLSIVDWSRVQFAVTACYHWLSVPLTLSLGFIMAVMETLYYRTGKEEWKRMTKFWMHLFTANFVLGIAGGIILEFQFGTNWSNYSWLVGDIFGAPLAIEGIMAFFLESTFFVVMVFGWNKTSKGFHLASTWLTWVGATLSALWILVANAWMQYPTGTFFNIDTVRNEMTSFSAVVFSPVAMSKFFHTVTSSWIIGAAFVIGVSSWYLLKKRNIEFAHKSIMIASIFGLAGILLAVFTGDSSAYQVAQKQPMKLAAMEGLYNGQNGTNLVAFGVLNPEKKVYNDSISPYLFKITIPHGLSLLAYRHWNAFVPGIQDLLDKSYLLTLKNGEQVKPLTTDEKLTFGRMAHQAMIDYRLAKKAKNDSLMAVNRAIFDATSPYFGYGYVTSKAQLVPDVPLTFYAFHFMVILGVFFLLFFLYVLYVGRKIEKMTWLLWLSIFSIPLAYLTSFSGWIVAEVGRQPWAIQDLLPTFAAASYVPVASIKLTLTIFVVIYTVFAVAIVGVMAHEIRKGPESIK
ncbi:cytochrome ubiquinol oxidase subunit I [Microbacter margulisiae]|uniref:Cytochrome d ubiquinol oxidase subunit I n=1 Tax=Microbacter margulisiae TaxID=1350067 RepID=A0A7W5DRS1_9PORP|nr:cytochrome ubiquinol oxidase subunit I [Microbacter margulisiae]MBB3187882.1 cytochrome d ubiquinol oxidase subunit I [Microbacter margulisiae]